MGNTGQGASEFVHIGNALLYSIAELEQNKRFLDYGVRYLLQSIDDLPIAWLKVRARNVVMAYFRDHLPHAARPPEKRVPVPPLLAEPDNLRLIGTRFLCYLECQYFCDLLGYRDPCVCL